MEKLRCAVIGVGYLGKFHAEKYAALPNTTLVAVVDQNAATVKELSKKFKCEGLSDYRELVGKVDAVSIVTPTTTHYEVAQFCLSQGIHCLIEKPITTTVAEADELIKIAKEQNALIQVGHLERFNSAIVGLQSELNQPKFIESHRIAPFNLRAKDVNVVLDLMIHDIDLICSLVQSDIKSIAANGAPILSNEIDIANARIEFKNGAVANVTASRAGLKQERMMRMFQSDAYISINLAAKSYSIYRKGKGKMFPGILGIPDIKKESREFPEGDALKDEIAAFANSILNHQPVLVTAEDGKRALEIAQQITQIVQG